MLARLAADYERGDKVSPWPDVYARGIVAGFPGSSGGEESAAPVPQTGKPFKPFKLFKLFAEVV